MTRASDSETAVHIGTSPTPLATPHTQLAALTSYKIYKKESTMRRTLKWAKLTNRVENTWKLTNGGRAAADDYDGNRTPHMYILTQGMQGSSPLSL